LGSALTAAEGSERIFPAKNNDALPCALPMNVADRAVPNVGPRLIEAGAKPSMCELRSIGLVAFFFDKVAIHAKIDLALQ
jgi:hypothetical protein